MPTIRADQQLDDIKIEQELLELSGDSGRLQSLDLKTYDFVWYEHYDGKWYPAQVLDPVRSMPRFRDNRRFFGKKTWHGHVRGIRPFPPTERVHIYVCPELGNVWPDDEYTRLLLKESGKLPADDGLIDQIMEHCKKTILFS